MDIIKRFLNVPLIGSLYLIILCSTFFPTVLVAEVIGLSPEVASVSKDYSDMFCIEVLDGATPEIAGEKAAKKIARGLIFSPVLKEITSSPKEALALSVSKNIYSGCGDDMNFSQQELDNYLIELIMNGPTQAKTKPSKMSKDPLRQLGIT